jgi:PAS domain S-box-containing protein
MACAVSLTALLPLHFALPAVVAVAAAWIGVTHTYASHRHRDLAARIEAIKGVRSISAPIAPWQDPHARIETLTDTLVRDLEESYFRLIKTNIQMLSLKEVGRTIIASLDRERTVQSVLEYLHRGVGFHEFGLFTWSPEEGVFTGGVRRQRDGEWTWVAERFALPEVDGVLSRAIGMQRSALIKDAAMHPLGSLHGAPLCAEPELGSFVVVPLVTATPAGPVWERRGCEPAGCPAAPAGAGRSWVEKFADEPDTAFWDGGRFRCWDCAALPLLGVVFVTDNGRDTPLSKIDLIMLETLAQNLSTVLENARLYEGLKREERFREHVFRSMANGLVSVDLAGSVQLVNQAAERLSGWTAADVRGKPSGDFLSENGRDPLRDALAAGRGVRTADATLRTAAGRPLPIRLTTSLLRAADGSVQGALGEFADQSAIKGMEAQIRHLDKLAALGRFTSSVAHEIRNPLAGITAGIQYLRKRMDSTSQEHVDFILAEVERLNRIIEDLLRVGRPLELLLHEADVEALVERSLRALEPRFAERGVRVERRFAPDLPLVPVDADRIEQVLINLIQNAVEASPDAGVVEIQLRLGSSQEPLAAGAEPDALVVAVHDHGAGIADENRDKIFEPFFTTKARGTGLGLYVCHHIVEGHGGSIVVDSACGNGTRFVMCLPLARMLMGGPV